MANCLKCGAKCAVHALGCETDVMKEKESIDCETFKAVTIKDTLQRQQERKSIETAFAVLRELRKQES